MAIVQRSNVQFLWVNAISVIFATLALATDLSTILAPWMECRNSDPDMCPCLRRATPASAPISKPSRSHFRFPGAFLQFFLLFRFWNFLYFKFLLISPDDTSQSYDGCTEGTHNVDTPIGSRALYSSSDCMNLDKTCAYLSAGEGILAISDRIPADAPTYRSTGPNLRSINPSVAVHDNGRISTLNSTASCWSVRGTGRPTPVRSLE